MSGEPMNEQVMTYSYDEGGRLESADDGTNEQRYEFDEMGNRIRSYVEPSTRS